MKKGINYHRLLWQALNNKFKGSGKSTFVLATGQRLLYSDYDVSGNAGLAAYNTFELLDNGIPCATNYSVTGSRISTKWEQLLTQGKGPNAGPQQQAAFEKARGVLYKVYDTEHTDYYEDYLNKEKTVRKKRVEMEHEYQKEYGDKWKSRFDKDFAVTDEYMDFQPIQKEVAPHLKAIEEWTYGPLAGTLVPMRKAFDSNRRTVTGNDGVDKDYYNVSMSPANWYQWFDPAQPADSKEWETITIGEHSEEHSASKEYDQLGGAAGVSYAFIGVRGQAEGKMEKEIAADGSRDLNLSFKVRSVQINRPWLDLSALKVQNYNIPGEKAGSWSTGEVNSKNDGSLPLISTQMIVARDITVTASKFNQEIIETMKHFDASAKVGFMWGLFSFGANSSGEYNKETADYTFDEASSSMTLKGTQVIGYSCSLVPKYPAS